MKITVDIPNPLIDEAIKLSNHKSKTAVTITALEDFVRKNRLKELKKFRGKVALDIDLDKLRNRQ
ncbi:MAG TPA: type II toxin-antitoxin system VapB family antitoxin [Proteobacteria bacterium]|nr:type II toxin-antitoxin system VapB family antitoxin [Pseudomonadota bacterium]